MEGRLLSPIRVGRLFEGTVYGLKYCISSGFRMVCYGLPSFGLNKEKLEVNLILGDAYFCRYFSSRYFRKYVGFISSLKFLLMSSFGG